MNLLPQFFYGMVVIGSLSMVGEVSVVSDVFDQLFLNAEYPPSLLLLNMEFLKVLSLGHSSS